VLQQGIGMFPKMGPRQANILSRVLSITGYVDFLGPRLFNLLRCDVGALLGRFGSAGRCHVGQHDNQDVKSVMNISAVFIHDTAIKCWCEPQTISSPSLILRPLIETSILIMSAVPAFSFNTTADEVATAFSEEIQGKNGQFLTSIGEKHAVTVI
jgi:hypothetical protein